MRSRPRVAIAGGGPAGACAGTVLARSGFRVSVYEAAPGAQDKIGDSLPPSASAILRQLDLLNSMATAHVPFYGNRSWWGSDSASERGFIFHRGGSGWRLNRREFEASLTSAARKQGVEWHYNTRVLAPVMRGLEWNLTLRSPQGQRRSQADFLIDATGRGAFLCRRLGAARISTEKLVGILGFFQCPASSHCTDSFTAVEAVESGWWYSAVQPDTTLAVIFFTDYDLPSFSSARNAEDWSKALRAAPRTSERARFFGPLTAPLRILPAGSARVEPLAGQRWLVAGDAAAAHDPLSSYGIVGAMGSGYYAGCAARDFLRGDPIAIAAYADVMHQSWTAYADLQRQYYISEHRWPESSFWCRRSKGQTL
ncbi:MAG: FAD-dependent monooxygenase [Acidobacteriaceae bacterium]|nr:FAD-dependent monooxygenase [Acidobacteriaceae bacterium]MBV9678178.1 FAD-dependent monooxygenase [Acidobacteriaceae bacterium]